MPSIDLDPRVFNATLAAILTGIVGVIPLLRRRDRLTWLFALSNLALALWNLGDAVVLFPESHLFKLWLFRTTYVAGILLVWFFYLFAFAFAQIEVRKFPTFWKILKLTGVVLILLCISPFLVADIDDTVRPFKEIPGPAYPLFIAFLAGGLGFALYQLFASYRSSEGMARTRLKYMFAALFFSFLEAIFFFLTLYFKEIPPYFYYLQVAYTLTLAYAIVVYRVMDIELLSRNATSWILAGTLCVLPFIVAVYLGRFLLTDPEFLLTSSTGTLMCSIMNFSLALATIRMIQNTNARRLCLFFVFLGIWNLAELLLITHPNRASLYLYRGSYGIDCLVLMTWFNYWEGFFDYKKAFLKKISRFVSYSAWIALVIGAFTPLVLDSLIFDQSISQAAIEVPGPLYSYFSVWFIFAGSCALLWPVSVMNDGFQGKRSQAGFWIYGSFCCALLAASGYFLYVQHKLSWYWYPPLQFILLLFLMGSLVFHLSMKEGGSPRLLTRQFGRFGLSVTIIALFTGYLLARDFSVIIGGFLGGAFLVYLAAKIQTPIQDWVDQTFLFRREFGHIAKAKAIVQKEWNLDSLESALPLVAQEVVKTTPYRACTLAIMFDEQPKLPFFHSTFLRLSEGELIEGTMWSESLVMTFLQLVRKNRNLCLREEMGELPSLMKELDPLLFEAAAPLTADGKIVGTIVLGPKEGKKTIFHGEDINILTTLAQTISQRLGTSVGLNLFRCRVNNILHDVIGHDVGPLIEKLASRQLPEDILKNGLRKIRENLLDLRSYAQGELEKVKELHPVDVENMLRTIHELHKVAAEKKGLQFDLVIPSSLPYLRLDSMLVDRCIVNLVTNAIKYTVRGHIRLSANAGEKHLVVCVEDTGIGIPRESIKRIFESGYRVPGEAAKMADGSGTGLGNVKDIIVALGGRVEVESELGHRSKFSLYFPLPWEIAS